MKKKAVPSMVKDQQLVKKRREQMVKGAVRLFIEKGFHRTTTREIAKESGFSIGTLYEYIGSKEDVLYLVCDAIYEEVRDQLVSQLDTEAVGIDRVKKAIAAYFRVIDHLQDEVLVMYQEAKSLPKEALMYVLQKEVEMTKMFEDIIRDYVAEYRIDLSEEEIKLMSHNILVQGHMWTFRRWAIRRLYTLEEYTKLQSEQLLSPLTTVSN
ncbi:MULTISPECIES: TetR/AcrR family transcriptional regulator [Alkalihalophilus]|uniref:TetR/AcrR family transcriptional regulator n=2 Tax=Alkalihalophilus pseudofirmus TaxID=79885 RepID=D3FPQ6_ALKPO|nr:MULTISPECIES: TetR/AcrR family transcriptional regulator [Alkalihalophilus]ADC49466.1 TetR/AcrR family transcriptional regulator [Alkalihalophilus pseudofirmus OF4]MCM3489726.1 TetR/AcrR family transcriptional regulator [Alkalihalophilus marmarensis]MDV2886503.1 TetR/AcrR family transcriptional regulator [Alkalihalophilus pseudofirmus]MEC2073517.1 TetR/AcrR family transcriptional regulator [Alkalihalophilus marmarensis]MED1601617.1 TetR/AcrR family transcriptional regulator [Alkalihalophilu